MSTRQFLSLVDTLARFSLKSESRRFGLGYVWWVLEPLLYVAVFYLVFELLLGSGRGDFLAFLVVGKLTFVWFSKTVNQAANSLLINRGLIAQRNLSKLLFPLAVVQEGVYKQLAVFALLLTFVLLSGYAPTVAWLWCVPLVMVQLGLIVVAALLAALLVCVRQDFLMVVQLGMILLLFVSGIFWDINDIANPEAVQLLLAMNPLALLIDSYRQVLLHGQAPSLALLSLLVLEIAVLLAGLLIVYRKLNFWIARRVML